MGIGQCYFIGIAEKEGFRIKIEVVNFSLVITAEIAKESGRII
jgi:hypothetical protein